MRAIIIEDETNAREHLKGLIETYCKQVDIFDEAIDVKSGYSSITTHKPDLIFLDIRMPDGTGFDLLRQFDEISFNIIFTTAYVDYAIEAFKFSAVHYLLKPIDPGELISAVEKAGHERRVKDIESRIKVLFNNMSKAEKPDKKVVLTTNTRLFVVNASDIIMCHSDRNYTQFFLADGRQITVSKTIKEFDDMLIDHGFFRPHRQYLINMSHVQSFEKSNPGKILLTGNIGVPVSVRKKEQLIDMISSM